MPTTSRKTPRARQRKAAASSTGRGRQRTAKRDNGAPKGGRLARPAEAKAEKRAADAKQKGDKIVRDTFKMPQREYDLIVELKQRCRALGVDVKKSEVLRAGLIAMRELSDERLGEVMGPLTAARAQRAARKPSKSATAA